MKAYVNLYLAEFFLEREMFQLKVVKIPKHIIYFRSIFSENPAVIEIM
jgi:hypothetical protein